MPERLFITGQIEQLGGARRGTQFCRNCDMAPRVSNLLREGELVMPNPDLDERDVEDRILDAPPAGPVAVPPSEAQDIDPVPEPLRPTPLRLTLWTAAVVGLFLVVAALFILGEFIRSPYPTSATIPPAKSYPSTDRG
jgi:hypothetical protein